MTTSTLTVTEFVLARIAEDESAAREVILPGPWTCTGGLVTHVSDVGTIWIVAEHVGEDGPHIARHDPARVLAQCAAMRKIVEDREHIATIPGHGAMLAHADFVLRQLTSIWSDHPDFDPAWS